MPHRSTPEALRAKYQREREKRLRDEGNAQYVEPTGRFAHFLADPFCQVRERAPVVREISVAIIGGGFAGLTTGARLKQHGIDDVWILEGGGDFGGAWYWNRYPGAMCDTAAMIYLPLLEETGHRPTQKYTLAPEIFEHARRIGTHFGLYERALFSTEVTSLTWEESRSRWIVRTNRGDELHARFVTMGTGPLHRPKLPGIVGIETFAGHCFHTSRWDYGYTGGSYGGDQADGYEGKRMDRLADKRVGIIGTGATGVQCIPKLARDSQALFVFQRTPSSIDVRNNHPIDPAMFEALTPGWQRQWLMNFATLQTGGFAEQDLVKDGWTDIAQRIRDRVIVEMGSGDFGPDSIRRAYEASDDDKMNEIRARVDAIVSDPATAEALKPWYRQLCKRPCFHDEYLQTYNLPNVRLVDTDGKGVERIDERGVWVGGAHYPLDCLIFASGFEVGTEHARRSGFETTGRDGVTLTERWSEGMRTLHGIHTHGFPNLFVVSLTQAANLISNVTHNLVEAGTTIAKVIAHAAQVGATQVEVTLEAEQAWVSALDGNAMGFLGASDCTPGYYNNEGKAPTPRQVLNGSRYAAGPVAYFEYIERWRNSGTFEGLAFRNA